jgi:hypothetical protein
MDHARDNLYYEGHLQESLEAKEERFPGCCGQGLVIRTRTWTEGKGGRG